MAARIGTGEQRQPRSLDERKKIVEEALAPGVSVAAVARRHGLNANFKWIRRSREGWGDRRREPARENPTVVAPPEKGGSAFVPVKLLEVGPSSAQPPSDVAAKPARQTRRGARRGAMEISLPNGAKVSLDAEVDAEALRRVLSALGFCSPASGWEKAMLYDWCESAGGECFERLFPRYGLPVET